MPYATQTDLETRFGSDELAQRTDREHGTDIDPVVVGRALADAEAEIDSYLGKRYQLPLSSVPALLVRIACDIALYRLCDVAPEQVRQRYEDAVRDLKRCADGVLVVDGAASLAVATGAIGVKVKAPASRFSAAQLEGY